MFLCNLSLRAGDGLLVDQIIILIFKKWNCVLTLLPQTLLFNLYINDLKQLVDDLAACALIIKSIKITILYAHDIILLSLTRNGLFILVENRVAWIQLFSYKVVIFGR